MRLIALTQNQFAKVDAGDYEWLCHYKWRSMWSRHTRSYYAIRGGKEGEPGTVLMHREILGLRAGDKMQGDHRSGDTLDNRRSNLRIATHAQNIQNQRLRITSKSGYRGVSFHTASGLYIAKIMAHGKLHSLGYRKTASEAHELYKAAAAKLHGEFARSN
jgi:hypothetical protein